MRRAKSAGTTVAERLARLEAADAERQNEMNGLVQRLERLESAFLGRVGTRSSSEAAPIDLRERLAQVEVAVQPVIRSASASTVLPRYGGGGETCAKCETIVYAAERIQAQGTVLHRDCFRCAICDAKLVNSPNWEVLGTAFYCGPHFNQIVRKEGVRNDQLSAKELQVLIDRKLRQAEDAFELDASRQRSSNRLSVEGSSSRRSEQEQPQQERSEGARTG